MTSFVQMLRTTAAAAGLAAGLLPFTGSAENAPKTLRFIPQADLRSIDPIWTTAYVTRNFGYLVFDTLFALDKDFKPQPQMVDRWTASDDKMTYNFTLREAANGMMDSRSAPSIASPRSNAGASGIRSARS
jgi:peptide/nickel transport system substrate-binding protein